MFLIKKFIDVFLNKGECFIGFRLEQEIDLVLWIKIGLLRDRVQLSSNLTLESVRGFNKQKIPKKFIFSVISMKMAHSVDFSKKKYYK
jgi:hypothetical protein